MIHLETDRLILRDYVEDDLSEYCRLKMDSQTMYYLQDIQLHSFEEGCKDFANVLSDIESDKRQFYFLHMELKDTHEQVGSIGYTVVDETPVGKIVHFGYFTYPKFWGNGYTSEAMRRVLKFALLLFLLFFSFTFFISLFSTGFLIVNSLVSVQFNILNLLTIDFFPTPTSPINIILNSTLSILSLIL